MRCLLTLVHGPQSYQTVALARCSHGLLIIRAVAFAPFMSAYWLPGTVRLLYPQPVEHNLAGRASLSCLKECVYWGGAEKQIYDV